MNYSEDTPKYYSPLDDAEETTGGFVPLDNGIYILELVGSEMRISKGGSVGIIGMLKPLARVVKTNGSSLLEKPNNWVNVEANFWLFTAPKDEMGQPVPNVGCVRNSKAGSHLAALLQVVSGFTLKELAKRYTPTVEEIKSADGLTINAPDLVQEWHEVLINFVIEDNRDPDVTNHKLVRCAIEVEKRVFPSKETGDMMEWHVPKIVFHNGFLYAPLFADEWISFQEFYNSTYLKAPSNSIDADDFVGPDGKERF